VVAVKRIWNKTKYQARKTNNTKTTEQGFLRRGYSRRRKETAVKEGRRECTYQTSHDVNLFLPCLANKKI
jgi:hypothetical protein